MVGELTETVIRTIQDAAKRLTGAERRKFEAQVARDYCQGSARKAETIFGWGRVTVQTGLDELQTGVPRENRYSQRGRRKAEDKLPSLEEDIRKLLEPQSQTDPKFQSTFLFTRATGQAVREALLLRDDVYTPEDLPSIRTMRRVMNRFGFRLRRVQKAKPAKKIPETDAIFEQVKGAHNRSAQEEDCLQHWWSERKAVYPHIGKLQIDLDNGPELASNRTQFIKRIVQFADQTGLTIELVYYPPYHSKYNSVERCWGILEEHWNGAILDSVDTVLSWAQSMTWKGVSPIVRLLDKTYERGVRLSKRAFRSFADRLRRSPLLPKWSATILPLAAEPA